PAGEVPNLVDAGLTALGDDIGGAEFAPEIGTGDVPPHEDDPLGSEPLGRQHGHEADGSVADDRDRGPGADAGPYGGMVAGAVDVREGEQGRDERRVLLDRRRDQGAIREWHPDRLSLAATDAVGVPEPAVPAGGLQ